MNNFDDILTDLCLDEEFLNDIFDDNIVTKTTVIDENILNDISPQYNTLQQVINKLNNFKRDDISKYKQLLNEFTRNFDEYQLNIEDNTSNDFILDDNLLTLINLLNNKNE